MSDDDGKIDWEELGWIAVAVICGGASVLAVIYGLTLLAIHT